MRRILIWILATVSLSLTACDQSEPEHAAEAAPETVAVESVEIMPGLTMRMLREGDGATAEAGHTAVVHYTGWLYDETAEHKRGNKFDSSVDRGRHFEFPLGGGRVIRGWDEGVIGMKIGEIRELTIAPDMAYGDRQVGDLIPPGSTLVFEVELANLRGLDAEPEATE